MPTRRYEIQPPIIISINPNEQDQREILDAMDQATVDGRRSRLFPGVPDQITHTDTGDLFVLTVAATVLPAEDGTAKVSLIQTATLVNSPLTSRPKSIDIPDVITLNMGENLAIGNIMAESPERRLVRTIVSVERPDDQTFLAPSPKPNTGRV